MAILAFKVGMLALVFLTKAKDPGKPDLGGDRPMDLANDEAWNWRKFWWFDTQHADGSKW